MKNLFPAHNFGSVYLPWTIGIIIRKSFKRSLSNKSLKMGRVILHRLYYDYHTAVESYLDRFELHYKEALTSGDKLDFSHEVKLAAIESRFSAYEERARAYLALLERTLLD